MPIDYKKIVEVARNEQPAELVIHNGRIVNVFSGEIYPGGIAITGNRIAATGDMGDYLDQALKVIDAEECYITPGLIDGHVHLESSMLSPNRFAELALAHGTTSIMTDLHEVAVVGGLEAVQEILENANESLLKIYFVIPSHVPFSPGLETTGSIIGPEEISTALNYPRVAGLSEIVVSSALGGDERLWESMELVRSRGKLLHGHGPFTYGGDLAAFASLGIHTDHESFTAKDGIARLRAGIHLQIRHGSAAESIPEIIKVITKDGLDSSNTSVITDDILAEDLYKKGYQDVNIRLLQEEGIDPMTAIQMVTINAAKAFRLEDEIGVLAPGRQADVVLVKDLVEFKPHTVLASGVVVMEERKVVFNFPETQPTQRQLNSIHINKTIHSEDIEKLASCSSGLHKVKVHVLNTPQEIPVPTLEVMEVSVKFDAAQPDPKQDIAAISVVERHHSTGNIALAFIKGFQLKHGAMASSVAHDHHNIIAIGTNYTDIAYAINRVAELKGGQVVVENSNVLSEIALPILGLMSPDSVDKTCEGLRELTKAARDIGCQMRWPHMFMSFMSCSGGPGFSITDMGLLDGYKQVFIPAVIENPKLD